MAFDWAKYGVHDPRMGTSMADINHNIDRLYQSTIGRNADPGGRKYWGDLIKAGTNDYSTLMTGLTGSTEYKDRHTAVANNPNITEAELDSLDSAYVSPFHTGSGSVASTWRPGDAITSSIANVVTTDPNVSTSNYGDQTNFNVGNIKTAYNAHNAAELAAGGTNFKGTGGVLGGVQDAGSNFISGDDLTAAYKAGGAGSTYDDSALLASIGGLTSDLSGLKSAFDQYKTDMQNMWNNANWGQGGYGQAQTVGGVRTQQELPGWAPKSGGTAGFFGRGGNRFGLSTKSLNI